MNRSPVYASDLMLKAVDELLSDLRITRIVFITILYHYLDVFLEL